MRLIRASIAYLHCQNLHLESALGFYVMILQRLICRRMKQYKYISYEQYSSVAICCFRCDVIWLKILSRTYITCKAGNVYKFQQILREVLNKISVQIDYLRWALYIKTWLISSFKKVNLKLPYNICNHKIAISMIIWIAHSLSFQLKNIMAMR